MNGRGRRNKGLSGERELAHLLHKHIKNLYKLSQTMDCSEGVVFHPLLRAISHNGIQRNTSQAQMGGSDITSIPFVLIEVKRCETLSVPAWWRQVNKACRDYNHFNKDVPNFIEKIPVVAYRQNRKKWKFIVPMKFLLCQGMPKLEEGMSWLKQPDDMLEMGYEAFLMLLTKLLVRRDLAWLGLKQLGVKPGVDKVTFEQEYLGNFQPQPHGTVHEPPPPPTDDAPIVRKRVVPAPGCNKEHPTFICEEGGSELKRISEGVGSLENIHEAIVTTGDM